jgi:hypothetical protein
MNMSFFLTEQAFIDREKDVTRRLGWTTLLPGKYFTAVRKVQGRKKGEKIVVLGQCQCISNKPERLIDIIKRPVRDDFPGTAMRITDVGEYVKLTECEREGFPNLTPEQFVDMICRDVKDVTRNSTVNRIVFKRLD